ncbi:Zn-ribbon domain-containing OB-fold protein [Mycolicibacterium goodii]|uniref:Zn-ribbon domain-containing OB-fold protein n=1 Tax=Mycolicibacterium goodii TaxID=134601 RepID=UPI000ADE3424
MTGYIIPPPGDPADQHFWDALRRKCLQLQHCEKCDYVRFPASERCPECWEPGGRWRAVEPSGTVWSHTTYHRPLHPDLRHAVPYTVALVELDSGPVLPGRITGAADAIRIGARVEGRFTAVTAEFTMLEWALRG